MMYTNGKYMGPRMMNRAPIIIPSGCMDATLAGIPTIREDDIREIVNEANKKTPNITLLCNIENNKVLLTAACAIDLMDYTTT